MVGYVRELDIAAEDQERRQRAIDEAVQKEREAIVHCIMSTTWSGYMEIVEMIRRRAPH
jgi:hypothetical protein